MRCGRGGDVGVQELWERGDTMGLGAVGPGVVPFLLKGPVEAFDLAVGLGPVGPGPLVGAVPEGRGEGGGSGGGAGGVRGAARG